MGFLTQASHQWATRPADERFLSLDDMESHFRTIRSQSRAVVVPSRRVHARPLPDNKGLEIAGPDGNGYAPTNWAFGQVAQLAGAPAGYLRTLPAPIAADCVNYGLQYERDIEDVGFLLQRNGESIMRAATGPRYGRIWNSDVVAAVQSMNDRSNGRWAVPSEFGKFEGFTVTKENTTLYASDRDMFCFLADERNRVEIPNRRNGQPGTLARGFFVWNSEVGKSVFGLATFLFDFACKNRTVWGAESFQQITIRHTASAPEKWLAELQPALQSYAEASTAGITKLIEDARAKRLDNVDDFLSQRFGKRMVETLKTVHMLEENRPIESLWDASNAVTAHARGIEYQDARIDLETKAGEILKLAA